MSENPTLTYSTYLRVDELLALQQPQSDGPEHDETLFIVIHQVYELWFKQLLHELRYLRAGLLDGRLPQSLATLRRALTILKTLVSQVDVLETMTPLSFNAFRSRLQASSGFQSWQFHAVEFILGHKRPALLAHYAEDSAAHAALSTLLDEPSIYEAFLHYLQSIGLPLSAGQLVPLRGPRSPSVEVQAALLSVYREHPFPAQLCEQLVDLDEGLQEWRYRHVKMVERTIGSKPGSGGSSGVGYLRETLFTPLFPDLWAIRAQL
jgi:tryptophan 2,3-dioxygenase